MKNHFSKNPSKSLVTIYDNYIHKYGYWIGHNTKIEGIQDFQHRLYGIFISGVAKIGKDAAIFQ